MCPVCFYDKMLHAPQEYNICPCCGTEFESDDEDYTHAELRSNWIAKGAKWFFRQPPTIWNPWQQLASGYAPLPYAPTASYFTSGHLLSASLLQSIYYSAPIEVKTQMHGETNPFFVTPFAITEAPVVHGDSADETIWAMAA